MLPAEKNHVLFYQHRMCLCELRLVNTRHINAVAVVYHGTDGRNDAANAYGYATAGFNDLFSIIVVKINTLKTNTYMRSIITLTTFHK